MKKLLILIGAAVLLFGCTGPMGPQGPQGPQGEGSQTFTLTYKLASADWEKNTDAAGNFIGWWHEIQMPELSTNTACTTSTCGMATYKYRCP